MLEAISKMAPEQNQDTGHLNKAQIVLRVIFVRCQRKGYEELTRQKGYPTDGWIKCWKVLMVSDR